MLEVPAVAACACCTRRVDSKFSISNFERSVLGGGYQFNVRPHRLQESVLGGIDADRNDKNTLWNALDKIYKFHILLVTLIFEVSQGFEKFRQKIASKLTRTYTDKHGLKELCKELVNVDISKQKQSSDWGNNKLSHEQLVYAASDVLYLHKIKYELDIILKRENRDELAEKLFQFTGTRAYLDLNGWNEPDIFDH